MLEMQSSYGRVSPPYWSGDVWIVAGGPSAKDFDFAPLRGARVILVNDACTRLSSPTPAVALFSLDQRWIRRNRDFLEAFPGEKYFALPLETWPDCGGIQGATYLRWGYETGLSDNPKVINTGCHSGYGALNLAYLKRANRILLVGFDLDPADEEQYYYWAKNFETTLSQLYWRGTQVINLNPNSYVTAYPRCSLATFLAGEVVSGHNGL